MHGDWVHLLGTDKEILANEAALRHRGAFLITAGAQLYVLGVDDRVVFNQRVLDGVIAVDGRVGYGVHDDEGSSESVPRQTFKIIVANRLARVDDTDAARVIDAIAEKDVAFHEVAIAVTKRQGSA